MINKISVATIILGVLAGCTPKKKVEEKQTPTRVVQVPRFNADSAYFFVEQQVKFGPRVPGTKSHQQAADYFINRFKKYGATVTIQDFDATTCDNQKVQLKNIIASYNQQAQKRILLAAHWDTRPYADTAEVQNHAPFDGANDGASGAGLLVEVARV